MQVFKTFLKIAKKKFPSVLLYYIIFTVIVIAMSKIGASDHETSFTATKADIYIIDEDDSTASHALSDYLSSMHNPVTLKDTDTMTLQDALYYQSVDYILTIPEGFEEQLTDSDARDFLPVSMRKDNSNGYFVDQQVTEYLSSVRLFMAGGFSLSEAITKSSESLSKGNDTTVLNLEEKETDGAQIGLTYFFQYLPYVLINMLLLGMTPILMTFRTSKEGGEKSIEPEDYAKLNIKAAQTGYVDFIDVEIFTGDAIVTKIIDGAHAAGVKVIASNHDFHKTPEKSDIIYRLRKMQDMNADIPKIAVMPQNKKDVLTLLSATEEMTSLYADRPIITMSMAGTGVISRLCGEVFGSSMTFGAAKKASAPGQMGVKELETVLGLLHSAM